MKLKIIKSKNGARLSTYLCNRIITQLHFIAMEFDESGLPLTDPLALKKMQAEIRIILNNKLKS